MNFPSKYMEDAVNEFSKLPGIGKKTALRLVLYILKIEPDSVTQFTKALDDLKENIKFCKNCNNISDEDYCAICKSPKRDHSIICVVENIRDLLAIENTNQHKGEYHVLGGIISPIDGVGPNDIRIDSLIEKANSGNVDELIMALNPSIEGDTTIFYISKKIKGDKIKITTIARGVSFGGELEYTDDVTLARSIATRLPYNNVLQNNR